MTDLTRNNVVGNNGNDGEGRGMKGKRREGSEATWKTESSHCKILHKIMCDAGVGKMWKCEW